MTTTATAPAVLLDDLQTSVGQLISDLTSLAPLVTALVDSHQTHLGFLTYEGKLAQGRLHRAERRAAAERAAAGYTLGAGASPAPGNISALSVAADFAFVLRHSIRVLRADLERDGVCSLTMPPSDRADVDELLSILRSITNQQVTARRIRNVMHDLEYLKEDTLQLIDGNDKTTLGVGCPHCGRLTLVIYLGQWLVRCDRDPKTGRYEDCTCPDPVCACKNGPADFRHEWHRAKANKPNGWGTLVRLLTPDMTVAERKRLNHALQQTDPTHPDEGATA